MIIVPQTEIDGRQPAEDAQVDDPLLEHTPPPIIRVRWNEKPACKTHLFPGSDSNLQQQPPHIVDFRLAIVLLVYVSTGILQPVVTDFIKVRKRCPNRLDIAAVFRKKCDNA